MGKFLLVFITDHHEYPLYINTDAKKYEFHEPIWLRSLGAIVGLDPKGIGASSMFTCPNMQRPKNAPPVLDFMDYGYNSSGILANQKQMARGLGGKGGENSRNFMAPPVKESEVVALTSMIAMGDSFQANLSGTLADGDARIRIYYWVQERAPGSLKRA